MTSEDSVTFRPIGIIRTQASEADIKARNGEDEGLNSTIELLPEFEDGLDGLEGCSHLYVITFLNKLRPDQVGPLKVRPRRLLKRGFKLEELPLVGVFAIDSPTRPNPIGLSLVTLLHRENRRLIVRGLDCFDGTPVLDIKPYTENHRLDHYATPEWYRKLLEMAEGHI